MGRYFWVSLLALNTYISSAIATEEMGVEYINSESNRTLNLPFSEAVRVGNTLYLSGALGNIPGQLVLVEGGIEAETHQTMANIKHALELSGSSLNEIVKCQVFLADINEWSAFNAVYRTYFNGDYPARSALGASGLALGARVELDCIATIGLKRVN